MPLNIDEAFTPGARFHAVIHQPDGTDEDLGVRTIERVDERGLWSRDGEGNPSFTPIRCHALTVPTDEGFVSYMAGVRVMTVKLIRGA